MCERQDQLVGRSGEPEGEKRECGAPVVMKSR